MSYKQENLIHSLSKLNIGPVKAFNIMRTHCGGFEEVGVTSVDCKNFKRDINLFIGKYDAEMVVRRLMLKKEFLPDFSCEYFTSDDGKLGGLFWAEEDMKRNYRMFGDVVAFDSTFRSNKYDMVFLPFTGIDNHHRNVTLGAALLSSETAESYKWLLCAFKKSFGSEPRVVVTDQDAAMKKAVEEVFQTSRHRLCMWHIMKKVAEKVGKAMRRDCRFKSRLRNIVWNDSIQQDEFESKWKAVMENFNLESNEWLADMYDMRSDWIPACYRHIHMSGLMRTTSRSESENHFFGQFTNSSITLVEFLSNFETAMEAQRFTHRKNDHDTRHTIPNFVTEYELEMQANEIYTRNIFYDVQEEIYHSVHKCMSLHQGEVGGFATYMIKELDNPGGPLYEVLFREEDMVIICSCNRFKQYNLLCRHAFYVLRVCDVKVFPKNYITKRWTRDVVTNTSSRLNVNQDSVNENVDGVNGVVRDIMRSIEYIVDRLVTNMEQLVIYRDQLKGEMAKVDESCANSQPIPKKDRLANVLGFNQPEQETVHRPIGIRTKGCGSKKRFKSLLERASSKPARRQRACHACGSMEHDRRTCPDMRGGASQPKAGEGTSNQAVDE